MVGNSKHKHFRHDRFQTKVFLSRRVSHTRDRFTLSVLTLPIWQKNLPGTGASTNQARRAGCRNELTHTVTHRPSFGLVGHDCPLVKSYPWMIGTSSRSMTASARLFKSTTPASSNVPSRGEITRKVHRVRPTASFYNVDFLFSSLLL